MSGHATNWHATPNADTSKIPPDVLYRSVFESAVDFAMIVTDLEGRITAWNVGAERVLGWSASEMVGEPVDRFFTDEDRADERPAIEMRLSLADGRAADERWHLRKDGSRFWASGEMMPLRDLSRGHIGFLKILRDRTEARVAGLALREAEGRRATLLDLNDRLRDIADPADLSYAACEVLGTALDVSRVGYGVIDKLA